MKSQVQQRCLRIGFDEDASFAALLWFDSAHRRGRVLCRDVLEILLGEVQDRRVGAFIAWHTVSNLEYIVKSAGTGRDARGFLRDLLEILEIAPTTSRNLVRALGLKMKDFEDALQAAAALACGAEAIVTRNVRDYRNSPVPAMTPKQVLAEIGV